MSRRSRLKRIALGLPVLALLLLLFLCGPRIRVDETIRPIDLARLETDPDRYLADLERHVDKLRPGLQKMIRWRYEDHRRTEFAIRRRLQR